MFIQCVNGHTSMSSTLWCSVLRPTVAKNLLVGGRKCSAFLNVVGVFISVPYLLIVLYGPDFWYRSFDLFQVCHSMKFDYIFRFQFGPYSFNFRIGLKSLNMLGTEVLIFLILSFDGNWLYILFSFQPLYF